MFTAKDERNRTIYISTAVKDKKQGITHHYYCPGCHGELIVRSGAHQTPCFAHKSRKDCDDFAHGVSEWYQKKAQQIPLKYLEKPITHTFSFSDPKATQLGLPAGISVTHLADACIQNYVIVFQDSFLSQKEFQKRQYFFEASGYRVIWVINLQRPCLDNRIWAENLNSSSQKFNPSRCVKYFWSNPTKMLNTFSLRNKNCIVLLELQHGYWENQLTQWKTEHLSSQSGKPFLQRLVWAPNTSEQGIKNLHIFIGQQTVSSLSELATILSQ